MRTTRTLLIPAVLSALLATAGLLMWSAPALSAPLPACVGTVATRFSASRDGFAFINRPGADRRSLLGRVVSGLCGGMSYASLDYFRAGRPPVTGGIDAFLIVRNIQSVIVNAPSFVLWTLAPDTAVQGAGPGLAASTRTIQLPELDRELRSGPVPLGLVKASELSRIGKNHQVVAYALERERSIVRVRVYDPNHPGSDDTFLRVDLSRPSRVIEYSGGRRVDSWRGFFIEYYAPATPPRS